MRNRTWFFFFFKYALRKKCTFSSSSDTVHWLDLASSKYSKIQISDTKSALDVLYIYIFFPVFWALYEQQVRIHTQITILIKLQIIYYYISYVLGVFQGSRLTFQATLMNGMIDGIDWEIKPEQMHVITPIFILMIILSSDYVFYPVLKMFGIRKPIQKLLLGCSLMSVAFFMAAFLQYKIFVNIEFPIIYYSPLKTCLSLLGRKYCDTSQRRPLPHL